MEKPYGECIQRFRQSSDAGGNAMSLAGSHDCNLVVGGELGVNRVDVEPRKGPQRSYIITIAKGPDFPPFAPFFYNNVSFHNKIIMSDVKRYFKPEFLNRIDEIIFFNSLTKDNLYKIIDLEKKT